MKSLYAIGHLKVYLRYQCIKLIASVRTVAKFLVAFGISKQTLRNFVTRPNPHLSDQRHRHQPPPRARS